MLVLITRPLDEAEALAATLKARGIECMIEPMLTIKMTGEPVPALDGVQALLFTSANGVNAFALKERRRDLPVFAVGERTAEAARAAGFGRIESARGTVEELATLLKEKLDPRQGALFHATGSVAKGDLMASLAADGYEVWRGALYDATAASALSGTTITALRDGRIDMVLLFSPRTAETFVDLARSAGVEGACVSMIALCLSPAVAQAAKAVRWREVRIASRPERSALIELLETPADVEPPASKDASASAVSPAKPETDADNPALAVIRAFGGIRPMATKLGVPVTTVQGWKERSRIPATRVFDLRAAAAIHGVNLDAVDLAAATAAAADGTLAEPENTGPEKSGPESAAPKVARAEIPSSSVARDPAAAAPASVAPGPPNPNPAPASDPNSIQAASISAGTQAPRRTGLALALLAVALAGLAVAAGVSLPYWGARVGILPPAAAPSADLSGLKERTAALEQIVDGLASRPAPAPGGANSAQLSALTNEIAALKDQNAKLAADAAALHQQIETLLKQSRTDTEADARRAALVLAVGQLEAALMRPGPYGRELADIAALSQGDGAIADAVAALKPRAATGIPTLAELTQRFEPASLAAARAAIVPKRPGLLGAILARLETLVVIRRIDGAGEDSAADLARASAYLKTGDLADAVAEVGKLEGAPAAAMAPWLADARARLAAEAALSALSSRALGRLGASPS
jgi:uroporphyrinogen-III synthase